VSKQFKFSIKKLFYSTIKVEKVDKNVQQL
jgi:hypothetical protein